MLSNITLPAFLPPLWTIGNTGMRIHCPNRMDHLVRVTQILPESFQGCSLVLYGTFGLHELPNPFHACISTPAALKVKLTIP
jgi:hypothetical protein